jgi:hypothetical protein
MSGGRNMLIPNLFDNEWFRLIMYTCEAAVSISVFSFMVKYLQIKYREGVVSAFMLSVFTFSFFYGIQNIAAGLLWVARTKYIGTTDQFLDVSIIVWTSSHIGTTITFYCMGILIVRERFDLHVTLLNPLRRRK